MVLDLSELPAGGREIETLIDWNDDSGDEQGPLPVSEARLSGRLVPGPRGIDFTGRVEAGVRLECGRCLESFERSVDSEFVLIVVTDEAEPDAEESRMDPANVALCHAPGARLDLREVVREQILLQLPLKVLCRRDCAGLCPTCGANRNRLECGCLREAVDPRLNALRALSKNGKQEDGESKA